MTFSDFNQPLGLKMNENNRWIKKAELIPWEKIEVKYAELFKSNTGMPAKPLRMALGSLLIQKQYGYSDEELVEQLRENPYYQYFIGMPGYYDSLVSFFTQLTSRDVLPSEDAFAAALAGNNLYRKNALCKYLLSSIENQGKERIDTEPLTIEHIMPQNKGLSPEWQKMLGDNWESVHAQYLHTLGNLTLTGYNSELGDLPFGKKKEKLQEVHTKVTRLNETVLSQEDWNEAAIAARAESLVRTIAALFPIEQPLVAISFADPQYQEYTIDDPSTATYKTPNYYILGGERVLCSNFSDMLRSVIERLYARDDGIIKNMARSNERLIDWSQNVMFSFDPTVVTSGYKIKGTDIYENIGYSASHIISIIRALLDRYDIDQSEFVYSAKSSKTADGQD